MSGRTKTKGGGPLKRLVMLVLWGAGLVALGNCSDPPKPIRDGAMGTDPWWGSNSLAIDSPASIKDTVQMWADVFHIKRLYWRGLQDEMTVDDALIRKENFPYYDFYQWDQHLVHDVGACRLIVQEAHKHGMEVYAWVPLFDFGGPADTGCCDQFPGQYQFRLTLEHPEWMPVDRYGFRRQYGPVDLSYPEARKALIDLYVEALKNGNYDGLTFFTYTENFGMRFEDEFGFNQPIVDAYKHRYGIDIRTQDFDKPMWRYLRGEYVTRFLLELKSALKPYGKKLGVALDPEEPNFPTHWPYGRVASPITAGRIYLDWERWVREGIVDDLDILQSKHGAGPDVLQKRTIENCLQAVRGTRIEISVSVPPGEVVEGFYPYVSQGLRFINGESSEAKWIEGGYPEQNVEALNSRDIYARMRVLAQIIDGKSKVNAAEVVPLATHENVIMRRLALRALATMHDQQALTALEAGLHDPENSVRCAAASGLVVAHDPETVAKLMQAVREIGQFQLSDTVSNALSSIDPIFLPQIIKATTDPDARIRRVAVYALWLRSAPEGVPAMLAALKDEDAYVRFRAAQALEKFGSRPQVIEALVQALGDTDVAVQDGAAVSLGMSVGPAAHLVGQDIGIGNFLNLVPVSHPAYIALNATQQRVLDSLMHQFQKFGDGCTRADADWGFRPVGNAILAFGGESVKRLRGVMEQKGDRHLAELAWQVLYVPQAVMDFCPLDNNPEKEAAAVYRMRPNVALHQK